MPIRPKLSLFGLITIFVFHTIFRWLVFYLVTEILNFLNFAKYFVTQYNVKKAFVWDDHNKFITIIKAFLVTILWDFSSFLPFTLANIFLFLYTIKYLHAPLAFFVTKLAKSLFSLYFIYILLFILITFWLYGYDSIKLYTDAYGPFDPSAISFLIITNILFYPGLKLLYDYRNS